MRLIDADKLLEHLFSKQDEDIDIAMEIAEFPPVNQWIPCSERLPKDERYVLVTTVSGNVTEAKYWQREGLWVKDLAIMSVVAWMPSPEPWEGKDESKERASVVY